LRRPRVAALNVPAFVQGFFALRVRKTLRSNFKTRRVSSSRVAGLLDFARFIASSYK
jgi:hypothetical protein